MDNLINLSFILSKKGLLSLIFLCLYNIVYSQSFTELDYGNIPVKYVGTVIDAYEMQDLDGTHLYLVTKFISKQTEIRGFKYSKSDTGYKLVWQIKDQGNEIAFHFPYTKFIDIEKDGRLETIFVYQINPGNADGSNWKIILHHKNRKYVLRAHVPEMDYDKYSVSIAVAPSNIKKYLAKYWQLIVKEKDLKTN